MERKNDMVTDEELYGQYLCGDETGLELLIKKYGDPLTLYIDGYLHDVHEAEDLMMETFSWLFTKKPRIRDGCFKAYLYKAARHMTLRTKADGGFSSVLTTWPENRRHKRWWRRSSAQKNGIRSCISAWTS